MALYSRRPYVPRPVLRWLPVGPRQSFAVVQVSAVAMVGVVGISGNVVPLSKFWRIPTNAPNATTVHAMVFSGTGPTYSIVTQSAATVDASGFVKILATTGNASDKAFAFVHDWADDTNDTNIKGGAAIATRIDE